MELEGGESSTNNQSTSVPIEIGDKEVIAAATEPPTKHRLAKEDKSYADPATDDEVGAL